MVSSPRSGKAITDTHKKLPKRKASSNQEALPEKETDEPEASSKKRKTDEATHQKHENNDSSCRLATPPPGESEFYYHPNYERTPGRDGPIKQANFTLKPSIKPFKGPPGQKVSKTRAEKQEEYVQFIRENEDHPFHELHVCLDKGPDRSPTYDKSGFHLDYDKVVEWHIPTPYNKAPISNGTSRAIDAAQRREVEAMAEIFFEKDEEQLPDHSDDCMQWRDRVSKDLNVPVHKVDVNVFAEWEKQGFKKARRADYQDQSPPMRRRVLRLACRESLRK